MAMRTWKHDLAENGHRMGKRTGSAILCFNPVPLYASSHKYVLTRARVCRMAGLRSTSVLN